MPGQYNSQRAVDQCFHFPVETDKFPVCLTFFFKKKLIMFRLHYFDVKCHLNTWYKFERISNVSCYGLNSVFQSAIFQTLQDFHQCMCNSIYGHADGGS